MKKLIPLLFLSLLMGQQSCETPPPNTYCAGVVPDTFINGAIEYLEQAGVLGANTIIGGELSTDRRATARVHFGNGYCTGVVLGHHTVLTAAHCGYASTTKHTVIIDGVSYEESGHLVHPDYWKYVNSGDLQARKSDLMLIYFDEELPGPYPLGFYPSTWSALCENLVAQGWGKDEFEETGAQLRESNYTVKSEEDKVLVTKQATWGGICFGDSGGPLWAYVKGQPGFFLAGITSTTASTDCLVASTHVKAWAFKDWIIQNIEPKS